MQYTYGQDVLIRQDQNLYNTQKTDNNLHVNIILTIYLANVLVTSSRLTKHRWTVNSTPMPTDTTSMTAGTALNLIPIKPIMPNSSTTIIDSTATCRQNVELSSKDHETKHCKTDTRRSLKIIEMRNKLLKSTIR